MSEGISKLQFTEYETEDPLEGFSLSAQDRERVEKRAPVLIQTTDYIGTHTPRVKVERKYDLQAGDRIRVDTYNGKSGSIREGILISASVNSIKILEFFAASDGATKYRRIANVGGMGIKDIRKVAE